jgi:hypothetical protein
MFPHQELIPCQNVFCPVHPHFETQTFYYILAMHMWIKLV